MNSVHTGRQLRLAVVETIMFSRMLDTTEGRRKREWYSTAVRNSYMTLYDCILLEEACGTIGCTGYGFGSAILKTGIPKLF